MSGSSTVLSTAAGSAVLIQVMNHSPAIPPGSAEGAEGIGNVTRCQELYLELMRLTRYNLFDGERVVADLLAHRDLWQSCLMTRQEIGITLRDLSGYGTQGFNNVDLLYLLAEPGREEELETLARNWQADAVEWEEVAEDFLMEAPASGRVLGIWWD